ncbi:NRDE family protein [Halopenitus sp. H-Gu1]|uniref:NRDE family protein n=1 Tax=Halopenitus sp. H-Gu1 TaxID=3242697 RepID=UPI00359CF728
MCTLTLAWNVFPGSPIVAVANRDEALDRPAEPPRVRPRRDDRPGIVSPRDGRAGGTWVGCTDRGVYATITNRWLDAEIDGDRSRGRLVDDCLHQSSTRAAVDHVTEAVDEHTYAGFNLIVADRSEAVLLEYDGELRTVRLDPGVHAISNVGGVIDGTTRFYLPDRRQEAGTQRRESTIRLHEHLRPQVGEDVNMWVERARDALSDHEFGACIHGDGFGTRSSSVVRVGSRITVEYADGPPCTTTYEPVPIPDSWPRVESS